MILTGQVTLEIIFTTITKFYFFIAWKFEKEKELNNA